MWGGQNGVENSTKSRGVRDETCDRINVFKIDSYYQQTARSYGLEAETFVLGILLSKPGLIDSSRIHELFSLGKKHDRDLFLSLVSEQFEKRDYRLRPLMAMLDWLDG